MWDWNGGGSGNVTGMGWGQMGTGQNWGEDGMVLGYG